MPGKRPRQIQRTTSMSQLGGGGMLMGARYSQTAPENFHGDSGTPSKGLPPPLKQELLESMEVCAGPDDVVAPGALMEDNFNSMAIDDSVEECRNASHAARPGFLCQANHPSTPIPLFHQSLHPGYPSQNRAMAPQASVYRGDEAGRSVQQCHFLDVCNRCSKRLGHGRDVFIYRGDRAFCSVECRHSQIVADEMREKCGMAATKEGLSSNTPAGNPPSTKQVETAAAA